MSTSSGLYFSVATVKVNPNKIDEVIACFDEIVKATMENEPGVKTYRYFKTKENEFIWISKFESHEAYVAHHNSAHVQEWLKQYPDRNPEESELYDGPWVFYNMSTDLNAGGFERP